MPKISIIIPIYNVEKYLVQCMESAVNQTLNDIEIICVNDCSTDNSLQIIQTYAQKDKRVKIINFKRNQGAGISRNAALEIAQGEYIMFLDSDDWLEINACEEAYNKISANSNDFVMFAHNRFYEDDNTSKLIIKMIKNFNEEDKKIYLKDVNEKFIDSCYIWPLIYKRDFLTKNEIKFPSYRIFEDQPFYIKVMMFADNFSIINKALYNHRKRTDSITYIYNQPHKDLYIAKKEILKMVDEYLPAKNIKRAIYVHTIDSCITWYNRYCEANPKIRKEFFNYIREIFLMLDKDLVKEIKEHIDYKPYKSYRNIVSHNWQTYIILYGLKNIINIKNSEDKKYKILFLFGFRIKFCNKKYEEKRKYEITKQKIDLRNPQIENINNSIINLKRNINAED